MKYESSGHYNKSALPNISLKDTLDPYYSRHGRGGDVCASMTLVLIGLVMGIVLLPAIRACDKAPEHVAVSHRCSECHTQPDMDYKRVHQRPTKAYRAERTTA